MSGPSTWQVFERGSIEMILDAFWIIDKEKIVAALCRVEDWHKERKDKNG